MRLIAIKDNIITNVIASSKPIEEVKAIYSQADDVIEVNRDAPIQKGTDIRKYNSNWELKTEEDVLQELEVESLQENEKIIFEDGWKIITSFKGEIIYNKEDHTQQKQCEEHEIPEGYTNKKPLEDKPSKFVNDEWVVDFDALRKEKKNEIKTFFEEELKEGSFFSTALQLEVDCRRNERDNDKQNVEGLIAIMERNEMPSIYYEGKNNTALNITVAQLKELVSEMEYHVFELYTKYHALKKQINETPEGNEELLNLIKWN